MTDYYRDETDNESFNNEIAEDEFYPIYDPEEQSLTKYNLVLCERYNRRLHGAISGEINNHYLTLLRFTEFDYRFIRMILRNHPLSNCKIEIAQCFYLPSEHCVSILKTYWLKLIQRTWKKIYKNRKLIISRRCQPNSLKHKELYGKWPINCIHYPTLKGMLSYLS
jgi:hypothetical protein